MRRQGPCVSKVGLSDATKGDRDTAADPDASAWNKLLD